MRTIIQHFKVVSWRKTAAAPGMNGDEMDVWHGNVRDRGVALLGFSLHSIRATIKRCGRAAA
jgi:hypothetical protein